MYRSGRPQLCLTAILFPTDELTLGRLIRLFPDSFSWKSEQTVGLYDPWSEVSQALMDAMDGERKLAKLAFESSPKSPDALAELKVSRNDEITMEVLSKVVFLNE